MDASRSTHRAAYEKALAAAHKWLWVAGQRAEQLGDEGAEEDLLQISKEVTRLAQDSLNGHRRTKPPVPTPERLC
jgi:hypothetical protein